MKMPGTVRVGRSGTTVQVGTCGYSYTEWVDSGFYPPGTRSPDMLDLYSQSFSVVELNYTWYQMARPEPLARMAAKAPPHLRFAAKLTRTMTHERPTDMAGLNDQLQLYREGIVALKERLLAVLVQLAPDFDRSPANRRYLAALLDGLGEFPVAVEFRHASWAVDSVFNELSRRNVTLVTVDEPELPGLFPTLDVVTNPDLFYVRFHGRNSKGWRSGNMQQKFNYDYSREELAEWREQWLKPLAAKAGKGLLFFNNHVAARAPQNGQSLLKLLEGPG